MPDRHARLLPGSLDAKRLLRWRVLGLSLAVVTIVLLPYLVSRASVDDTLKANTLVSRSAQVIAVTFRLAYEVRDSEAAIYRLIGGDQTDAVRQRADAAAADAPALLDSLRGMTQDNPAQQSAINALAASANGRLALMQQSLLRYRQGDLGGASAALRDAGVMYEMKSLIDAIVDRERVLLDQRLAHAKRSTLNNDLVLVIAAVAQVLLLGIMVLVSERQIGQRLRAEAREGEAVQRALLILQAVREPIALLDDKLSVLVVNAAFSELYGLPREQRQLQPLAEVGDGAWSDSSLLQRLKDVLLRDRELWDYELTQRTVDGVDRRVMINARRLHQHDSDAPVLLLTVSDVTARALVEQQVKELNRQLEGKVAQVSDVNRELEAFSYSVSHDLRAPLRHIAGFAGKLERHLGERADEPARHYLEVIRSASQRMSQLIEDLLVFSRLGRGALKLQAVDMQSLVEEARAIAESEAVDRRIGWTVAALPIVVGDENMLRMVWQNLIGNAVKYTAQREVARIAVEVRRGGDGSYEFAVADNGVGFDMAYADKLFGVFQRLHKPSEFPGNGIGLANVRRIVARHGGSVWAEGEPDQGAVFHFSLPAAEPADTTHGNSP
ncbi:ATP-binding protein [Frateuria defendens]|uniref:ATP-binding protein n=1 Tax=Frateuria defendens TaxID=2219559 RepID=UPI00066FBBE0|nr:ATP-binding protein [Frateuria defendens]